MMALLCLFLLFFFCLFCVVCCFCFCLFFTNNKSSSPRASDGAASQLRASDGAASQLRDECPFPYCPYPNVRLSLLIVATMRGSARALSGRRCNAAAARMGPLLRGLRKKRRGTASAAGVSAATPQRLKHRRTEGNSVDSSTRHAIRMYNVVIYPTRITMYYVVIT